MQQQAGGSTELLTPQKMNGPPDNDSEFGWVLPPGMTFKGGAYHVLTLNGRESLKFTVSKHGSLENARLAAFARFNRDLLENARGMGLSEELMALPKLPMSELVQRVSEMSTTHPGVTLRPLNPVADMYGCVDLKAGDTSDAEKLAWSEVMMVRYDRVTNGRFTELYGDAKGLLKVTEASAKAQHNYEPSHYLYLRPDQSPYNLTMAKYSAVGRPCNEKEHLAMAQEIQRKSGTAASKPR